MGCLVSYFGTIVVKDDPDAREAIRELQGCEMDGSQIDVHSAKSGKIKIEVNIGGDTSYSYASAIDDMLCKVGKYCDEGAVLETECENERDQMFLGSSPAVIRRTKSRYALGEIELRMDDLMAEDRKTLIKMLLNRKQYEVLQEVMS